MSGPEQAGAVDTAAIVWRVAPGPPPADPLSPEASAGPDEIPRDCTIFDLACAAAARQPDSPALVGVDETVTFAQLVGRATVLARRLAAAPPGPAAIVARQGPGLPICILACLAAGRTALLLSPGAPAARTRALLEDSAAACLIVETGERSRVDIIPDGAQLIEFGAGGGFEPPSRPTSLLPPPPESPAIVMFTSGSTGQPRGVVRSHRTLLANFSRDRAGGRARAGARTLCLADPTTGSAVSAMVAGMAAGMTQLLAPVSELGVARLVRLAAESGGVTHLTGTAALLCMLLRGRGAAPAFGKLEWLIVKGDAMLAADLTILRRHAPPDCRIWFGYGLTETSQIASWRIPAIYVPSSARVAVGYPLPGIRYALLDASGRAAPEGEAGELWISKRDLMSGEWRAGAVVRRRLTIDPTDPERDIFRTGDIARVDSDGLLHILGRRDRQVKINGVRIDPAEPENVLRDAPTVAEAVVLLEHLAAGPRLVAHIVPHADSPARLAMANGDADAIDGFIADLRARLDRALPASLHPARLVVVDRLPRIGTGKPDGAALTEAAT